MSRDEGGEAGIAAGELPDFLVDGEGELGGEARGAGRRSAEQAPERMVEAAEHAVEDVIVSALGGRKRGLGVAEAGEGAVPFSDRAGWGVTPDLIRGPVLLPELLSGRMTERRRWIPDRVRDDERAAARTPRLATCGARG